MARALRPVPVLHPAVWTVRAAHTPRVPRRCPRCDATRDFVSSDRFRLNAQKRRIDVFLIYRCPDCDSTWNAEVIERATPEEIGPALYTQLQENDAATAWRCAFAVPGADLGSVLLVVERQPPALLLPARITLRRLDPVRFRADRLLAAELGRSRASVSRAIADGNILVDGDTIVLLF